MAKKPSGLGRGLGDLLADNSLETQSKSSVVLRSGSDPNASSSEVVVPPLGYAPKSLYEEKPKNRSVKANFKK